MTGMRGIVALFLTFVILALISHIKIRRRLSDRLSKFRGIVESQKR